MRFHKVIELLSDEKVQMNSKQMSEILNLVNKEEILEMEEKVEKALGQAKIAAAHAAAAAMSVVPGAEQTGNKAGMSIEQIPLEDVKLEKEQEHQPKIDVKKDDGQEQRKKASNQSGSG